MGNFYRKNIEILGQQRFLYPLLFQDEFYAIAQNLFSNPRASVEVREEICKNCNSFSFFTVKRLIFKIRKRNVFLESKNKNSISLALIAEGLTLGLDVFFSAQWKRFVDGEGGTEQLSFQSIHSIFAYLDETTPYSFSSLGIRIPSYVHPELFIRMFNCLCWIDDVCFLHLLSSMLCFLKHLTILDKFIFFNSKGFIRLVLFLWNIFVSKGESSKISLWKQKCYRAKFKSFGSFAEQTHFHRKMKLKNPKIKAHEKFSEVFFFSHYSRFGEKSVLIGTPILIKKYRYFFCHFWQTSFFFSETYGLFVHEFSRKNISLIGYSFYFQNHRTFFRIKMFYDFFFTELVNNEFHPKFGIISIMKFLSIEGFCDIMGRPISKLSWTCFTDDDIFDKCDRFWKILYYYYCGAKNKAYLDRIKYILLLSCFKTIAFKHKSTIRVVRKEFDFELRKKFFPKEIEFERDFLCSRFAQKFKKWLLKINLATERFWLLNILKVHFLTKSWHKDQDALDFCLIVEKNNILPMLNNFL
uniref:Maturase K n=2 Tax=Welwitschia mirabilis TaxID=3377 RepID=MATK_WELMI|nr:maturase K [Welwitschia mirabilis]Q8MEW9.2 RecName: Full=Maturase K; AltName: Full=Intron maturase [Welwitschia mirabilis]ABY26774.1 maturase K [Welwitschia mirabilis]AMA21019.1 maturase K [Welwitschia mirabilis]